MLKQTDFFRRPARALMAALAALALVSGLRVLKPQQVRPSEQEALC
ncbi:MULTISPECIES: hypothetical protein [unclassified Neisseria]|nr:MULTISPECIES: hypothetical protein [unclassified Neisseria]MBF0805174.1 hypothetical protein [Neisseria sp. 19428wB4_WF04]